MLLFLKARFLLVSIKHTTSDEIEYRDFVNCGMNFCRKSVVRDDGGLVIMQRLCQMLKINLRLIAKEFFAVRINCKNKLSRSLLESLVVTTTIEK